MEKKIKVAVLRETKTPPDRRVAITPEAGAEILKRFPNVELYVQPSDNRCYYRMEYGDFGIKKREDIRDCDIMIGVKEVKPETLISHKTYIFFSHVAKKQSYNRNLLQEIVRKKITLMDYEYFTTFTGERIVAFGRWAGIVGTYNALRAKGLRNDSFDLRPAHECRDKNQLFDELKKIKLRPIKILITGGGRVANGSFETLGILGIRKVSPKDFLEYKYDEPVVCQLEPWDYVKHIHDKPFDIQHFFKFPEEYESTFLPYTKVTDMYIPCHFWDPKSPKFFTDEDMKRDDFKISVIADISCDVNGPVPSTIRASSIADPFYSYNRFTGQEEEAFIRSKENILVMAVDNLPCELPRDASEDFAKNLLNKVFPYLFGEDTEGVIERATIVKKGKLTPRFAYLQDFVDGKE